MSTQGQIPAKAITADEQSDGLVVSFGAEWKSHLAANDFSVVIRKRVPVSPNFKWLYFHINSPVGAICARAPIKRIFSITIKDALALAPKINLSASEIAIYIGNMKKIGGYELGRIQIPRKPITTADMSNRLNYYPPQSFFIISKAAKIIIDQMAGFDEGTKKLVKR